MPRLFSYLRCLISLFVLFLLPGSCSCRKLIESWLLINMIYFCVYLRFVTLTWKFSPPPGASSKEKSVFFFLVKLILKRKMFAGSAGIGFTPHVITVKAGEVFNFSVFFSILGNRFFLALSYLYFLIKLFYS